MIKVPKQQLDEIRDHGVRDYPYECCGLLLGRFGEDGKTVVETYPISNAREESAKRNRFLITPEELMRGERYARSRDLEVVGFYHSHPDSPAGPSKYDLEHAWPTYSYIIVSTFEGRSTDLFRGSRRRIARGLMRKGWRPLNSFCVFCSFLWQKPRTVRGNPCQ